MQLGPNRVNQAVVAGVALLGAGLIAMLPSTPSQSVLQEREVQLTSVDPTTVFSLAEQNLQTLINAVEANPDPVGTQLDVLNQGYENTLTTGLQDIQTAYTNAIDGYTSASGHVHEGLAATLQTIQGYVQQGDLFDAFGTYDYYTLESLEGITKPFGDILAIPGQISQTFTNVLENMLTFNSLSGLTEAFTAPLITEMVEFTQIFDAIEADFAAGDTTAALTAINNAPLELLGAYLNGDVFEFTEGPAGSASRGPMEFPGLLSFATGDNAEAGGLQQLLINFPQQLAEALGATSAEPAGALTNVFDPTLFTDFTSALDPSSLLGAL